MTQLKPQSRLSAVKSGTDALIRSDAPHFPRTPDITLNVNNRNSRTHPASFYDGHEFQSVANVLLRLEKAGCEVWAIAFNGNTLDVTVNAYDPYWLDKYDSSRPDPPDRDGREFPSRKVRQ